MWFLDVLRAYQGMVVSPNARSARTSASEVMRGVVLASVEGEGVDLGELGVPEKRVGSV